MCLSLDKEFTSSGAAARVRTRWRRQVQDAGARSRPAIGGRSEQAGWREPDERIGRVRRCRPQMWARYQIDLLRKSATKRGSLEPASRPELGPGARRRTVAWRPR